MVAIPDDMEYHGRGPMLSARRIDLNVLWRRAEQILQVCVQVRCLLRYQPYGLFFGLCGAQAGAGVHACATHAVVLESCGLGYTAVQRGIVLPLWMLAGCMRSRFPQMSVSPTHADRPAWRDVYAHSLCCSRVARLCTCP